MSSEHPDRRRAICGARRVEGQAEAPGGAPVESLPSSATLTVNAIVAALASTGAVAGSMLLVWAGLLLVGGAAFAVMHFVRRGRTA